MAWSNEWSTTKKLEQSIEAEVGGKPEDLTGVTPEIVGMRNITDYVDNGRPELKIATPVGTFGWNETRKISIKDGNKLRTVQVTIIGDLALEYDDDGWNIHHVPTLSKFNSAVPGYGKVKINWSKEEVEPCYEYDKQPLLNWMKKVQEPSDGCYEFNRYSITGAYIRKAWIELRCLTPENYKDIGQSAKDIIQQWCLSVKVE